MVVKALLSHGADVDQALPSSTTPLLTDHHVEVVEASLACGAVGDKPVRTGETSLMIACEVRRESVVDGLRGEECVGGWSWMIASQ